MSRITEDPWDALRREVDRSRRHERPVTLLRVGAEAPKAGRRGRHDLARQADHVRALVRSIDVVWTDRDGVYVLLPETDRAAAQGLVARLRAVASEMLGTVDLRLAAFPEDGLTANAVRDALTTPVGRPFAAPAGFDAIPEPEHR